MMTTTGTTPVFFAAILACAACKKEDSKQPPSSTPSKTTAASSEHAGKPAEHAGKPAEHAGTTAKKFTADQIKAAMTSHIEKKTREGGGVFKITDEKSGKELTLEFVAFHTPREISSDRYFLCTDFRPKGAEEGEIYDLDFWLNPKGGELAVTEARIHKHPKKEGNTWTKEARYKFVDDKVVELP